MSPETFLHAARLSSGLSLDDIARHTRLSPRVVAAVDQGRFDALPGGLYARSYVRAFADAVAADRRVVEEELVPLLPGAEDPVSAIHAIAAQAEAQGRRPRGAIALCAAACIDAAVLFAIAAGLLALVALATRISPGDLLAGGSGVAALGAVAAASYFIIFAGVDGRTPGRAVCGLPRLTTERPLRARQILDRAARIGAEELSLVITLTRRARRPEQSGP